VIDRSGINLQLATMVCGRSPPPARTTPNQMLFCMTHRSMLPQTTGFQLMDVSACNALGRRQYYLAKPSALSARTQTGINPTVAGGRADLARFLGWTRRRWSASTPELLREDSCLSRNPERTPRWDFLTDLADIRMVRQQL